MSECGCIYIDYDERIEECSLHNARMQKARISHKCTECGREVIPGEEYEYVFGKWGWRMGVYKTCLDCLSIREAFFCGGYYYTMILDNLHEFLEDREGELSSECLEELTPRAKEIVLNMIDEIWDEETN